MSRTTPFADLGKDSKDLLELGFPANGSVKVSHEITPLKGLVAKSSLSNDTYGPASESAKPKGVNATFEDNFKFNLGPVPVAFKGKAESSNVLLEGSFAFSDLITPGTEIKPWAKRAQNGEDKTQFDISGGVQLGYANDLVNLSLKTTTPKDFSKHQADFTAVLQYPKGLYWGFNAKYTHEAAKKPEGEVAAVEKPVAPTGDVAKKPAYELGGKIHLVKDDFTFTVGLETPPKKGAEQTLTFTWGQTLPSAKVATSFVIPREKKAPSAIVAYESKWDASTTVKSKLTVSKDSRLNLAYTQAVGPFVTATLGADLNANALIGVAGGEPNAFGFELKLK